MGVFIMILTANLTVLSDLTDNLTDDFTEKIFLGRSQDLGVSISSISGYEMDLICPKRGIIRFQFMLSFVQFFLTLLSGMSFVSFNQYACPTFFILCTCVSVVHSAVMMTSAVPSASAFFIWIAILFGILLIVTYWVTYCQYDDSVAMEYSYYDNMHWSECYGCAIWPFTKS